MSSVHVGRYEFDHSSYGADGDVLYLRRDEKHPASDTYGTPEGHAVQLDENGNVIGITIVNAKGLLEHDGKSSLIVASLIETDADEPAEALAAA